MRPETPKRTMPERPFGGKCDILMVLGTIGGSIGSFLSHFGSHFGIRNRKNGMSKDDRMKPGSQTPPWDALGSILGWFWVHFGHLFWTKKLLKIYDKRGAEYPAEHNVGHEYHAKPSLLNFYKQLDPTNRFNPGIGKTTKLKDWKQV